MTNIHNLIVELQKVRKQVDILSLEMQENTYLSTILDNCSLSITLAINDLVKSNKAIKTINGQENNDKVSNN